jgi:acetyl-CoA acetyltransferase
VRWQHASRVAVAGVGFSPIERRTTRPLGVFALEAAQAAVADCGLTLRDIDGLATYPPAPFLGAANRDGEDIITVEFFLTAPGMGEVAWYSQAGEGLVCTAVRDAVNALVAGACTHVLVWRAMYVPPGTYGSSRANEVTGDDQFTAPWGCVSPLQWHALAYRRYLETYGAKREDMAALVLNSRRNANHNEHAVFSGRTLSAEEYLAVRMITDPLCLFDCDTPVTACVAVVLTTAERARDLRHHPAYVASVAQQTVNRSHLIHYTLHDHIESGKAMADRLWRDAGLGPSDMSAAQLYDGFAPSTWYWLEAAGFCGRGEAHAFTQDGRIALGGQLPLNTFGGSLSQGRLHGMGHIAEAVLQLQGRAGPRQVADASAIAVFDGSPMLRSSGIVLTSEPV